jgi:hypothetical protein
MLTLKLQNSLNFTQDPPWDRLITGQLGESVHPSRRLGFCLARSALLMALKDLGVFLSIEQIELNQFDSLKGQPDFTLSLSHTGEWGAALVGSRKKFVSVGIDIESIHRPVNELVLQRVRHPLDISLTPISTWALKEAIFKTLMNTHQFDKNLEFSSIQLGHKTWLHPSGLAGEWKLEEQAELVIATAWLPV